MGSCARRYPIRDEPCGSTSRAQPRASAVCEIPVRQQMDCCYLPPTPLCCLARSAINSSTKGLQHHMYGFMNMNNMVVNRFFDNLRVVGILIPPAYMYVFDNPYTLDSLTTTTIEEVRVLEAIHHGHMAIHHGHMTIHHGQTVLCSAMDRPVR